MLPTVKSLGARVTIDGLVKAIVTQSNSLPYFYLRWISCGPDEADNDSMGSMLIVLNPYYWTSTLVAITDLRTNDQRI